MISRRGRLARWLRGACGSWSCFHPGQALQHASRGRGRRGGFRCSLRDDVLRGEIVLHQFGDDLLPGNQVDHGEVRHFDPRLAQQVGQRRDPVDHHERVSHHRGLDRRRAAGDDSGARVPERGQGFGDERWMPWLAD